MKKTVVLAVAVLMLVAGVAFAKGYEVRKQAGLYDVEIVIDRNPPVVGKNNMAIAVKDSAGKALENAAVKVDYGMPAMPGMPPMKYSSSAVFEGGKYKAVMDLSMPGPWNVTVVIKGPHETSKVKFSIDVS